jgi:hypothetical protein
MTDDDSSTQESTPVPPPVPTRKAKVLTLVKGVALRGFTFGARQIVEGVNLEMAKHLEAKGEVRILDIA